MFADVAYLEYIDLFSHVEDIHNSSLNRRISQPRIVQFRSNLVQNLIT